MTEQHLILADIIEAHASDIFVHSEENLPMIDRKQIPNLKSFLTELFYGEVLVACPDAPLPLIPTYQYKVTNKTNVHQPNYMVLEDQNGLTESGDYCVSLDAFINAFSHAVVRQPEEAK